ncbi:hypothetical protein NEOKW01_1089 [Nematocida sp. AWRm80]|nr:hypothetical protein NEOKW01_1089 [Nematocida sp. AWRm80]
MTLVCTAGHKGIVFWESEKRVYEDMPIAYDPMGILTYSDRLICLSTGINVYDPVKRVRIESIRGHKKCITAYYIDTTGVYTGSEDGNILVWDIKNSTVINTIRAGCSIYSLVVNEGIVYYTDYNGFVYRAGTTIKRQVSNCCISLSKSGTDLIGYDRRGRIHRIEWSDLSFSTELSIGTGYGIKCTSITTISPPEESIQDKDTTGLLDSLRSSISQERPETGLREWIGVGFSNGFGLLHKTQTNVLSVGTAETKGWVWDIAFSHSTPHCFFVTSDGTLQKVSLTRFLPLTSLSNKHSNQDTTQSLSVLNARVEFSTTYPLKCITIL